VYIESYLQVMKQEHYKLSQEAHECANSIPNMNKMIDGVQALGNIKSKCLQSWFTFTFGHLISRNLSVAQCDDLRMKYNEELAKRKKLYNEVQESKGMLRYVFSPASFI